MIDAEYGKYDHIKVGSFTRSQSTASGTQAVTGLGFEPSHVIFLAVQSGAVNEMSVGMDDGSVQKCVWDSLVFGADTYQHRTDRSIQIIETTTKHYYGVVDSMDPDGFTFDWTRVSTPTGTISIGFMAFG